MTANAEKEGKAKAGQEAAEAGVDSATETTEAILKAKAVAEREAAESQAKTEVEGSAAEAKARTGAKGDHRRIKRHFESA